MTAKALRLLVKASSQGHDQPRLEAERAELFNEIWTRLPRKPYLPPRLLRLTAQPTKLTALDADALIDAIRAVVGPKQGELSDKLLALTLIVARLGSTSSAMRIGLVAVEELRGKRSAPKRSPAGQVRSDRRSLRALNKDVRLLELGAGHGEPTLSRSGCLPLQAYRP